MSNEVTANLLPDDILPDVYRKKLTAESRRYHVGLAPNGPSWNQTFYGVSFPVYTTKFDANDNPTQREGSIVELTKDQISRIRESIRNRIVRWNHYPKDHKRSGERCSAQVFDVRATGFEPERTDEPLVKYVYFKEAPPEFSAPLAPIAAFEEMDKAIKSATATESAKLSDPVDAETRAKHAQLKRSGGSVPGPNGSL
jgi:hypothetical protein